LTSIERRNEFRHRVRQRLRQQRSALTTLELDDAAQAIAEHVTGLLAGCHSVAGYLAIQGELPLDITLVQLRAAGAITAVPLVVGDALRFVQIDGDTPMRRNRFGIDEPAVAAPALSPMQLDAVLVPLVAFDDAGNRLGMGGGFYDRCFATVAQRRANGQATPRLIGVAHPFQQVASLQPEAWDVPLDQVVTTSGPVAARNSR